MVELLGKPRPIDNRNRITLPIEVMKLLNLKPNDELYFKRNGNKIIVGKALLKYELIDEILDNKKGD